MKWLHNFLHGSEHMGKENIIIIKVRLTFQILKVIGGEGFGYSCLGRGGGWGM
jgi:hypothetical protein